MPAVSLGSFRISLVREEIYWWDGGVMFGVVPKTMWGRRVTNDELNRVPLGFNCYVIETGEQTVLIDSGGGDKLDSRARERMRLPERYRPLTEILAENGIDPERIDIVVNSHLHWDHCGANTTLCGGKLVPTFPRATYVTRRGEWEHAHRRHPRDAVAYNHANYDPLIESGRMQLIERDTEILPGVWIHQAPGHNRDLTILTASSAGETFCTFTDLVPTSAHLKPTWVAAFDLYPLESVDNKARWLRKAATEGWLCGFGHDPEIDFAYIQQSGNEFQIIE